ncbi:MAG TPA: polysaccharide biosynthesis C-terminal domain-containing protein [Thermoanaerobaculia bacterium]
MRLWKAVTLTSGTKAYWMIGGMVAMIITARFLGPQGRGVIAAASSWVALFVTFGHFSLSNVIVYLLAGEDRERLLSTVTGSVLALTAVTTLLGWAIAAVMYLATHGRIFQHIPPLVLAIAFAGLPFLLWMENGNSLLIILGDLKRLNIAQAVGTTMGILLVTIMVGVLKGGVAAAVTATLISYFFVIGIGLQRIIASSRPLKVSRVILRQLVGGGVRLHLAAVSTFFFTNIAVILLNQFRPVAEAGFFQLTMQLTLAMQVVPMAIAIVAYSIVTRDGPDGAWREHRTLILQTLLYSAVAAVVAYVAAPIAIPLLAGRAFLPAVPLFRVVALSIFGMGLTAVMAPQWVARGYFLRVAMISVFSALVGVVGNYVLIPRYGMAAAAWVMVASYTIHFVANAAFAVWIERRARVVPMLEPLRG